MQLHSFSRPAAAAAGLLLLAFAAGLSPAARADAGHDHGATPAAAPSAALPRRRLLRRFHRTSPRI